MIRVTSLDDSRVADYRLLGDHAALLRAGLLVAEGRLVVRRLLANPAFHTKSVLVTNSAAGALAGVLAAAPCGVYVVDREIINAIAGFNIHRGCLAIAERPQPTRIDQLDLADARRLVVMEGVNNPDNVGGIFRSAAAFGVDAVILGPACSDPLYRKSIRTSMAATLSVPFAATDSWPGAIAQLRAAGFMVLALTPTAEAESIDRIARDLDRVAVLVGAEGEGLSADALSAATTRVRIPMAGPADSLNVAVAASVALHWLTPRATR